MRAAPHVKLDGTIGPPIGTFEEQLARAFAPRPKPLGFHIRQRFTATLRDCPQFVRDIAEYVGPEIRRQEDFR